MNKILALLSPIIGKGRLVKMLFNFSPMYRSTGGRLIEVSDDLHFIRLKLPLNYKTKNYVGTLYGGHMYSCVDGIYMVQLIRILGNGFVVWDKAATIRFKRPGNQTLYAEFSLTKEHIDQIKTDVNERDEMELILKINLTDKENVVYAEVMKTIYIATKTHYRHKQALRNKSGNISLMNS